ncbi:MAG: hypothetical protein Ct9H300mP7_2950 [Verrucomicrobiota bacterium]|nr:MAG: hypothetical protein Ct9H300mP7_2950 [Verrucomicrobiota bacterium]
MCLSCRKSTERISSRFPIPRGRSKAPPRNRPPSKTNPLGQADLHLGIGLVGRWRLGLDLNPAAMLSRHSIFSALLIGLRLGAFGARQTRAPSAWFAIRVVDEETGRGVPLVELETVNHLRFYTDSNGTVAFHEPGLMDRQIFFHSIVMAMSIPRTVSAIAA